MARKTALDVSVYTLAGFDCVADGRVFMIEASPSFDDGRSINSQWARAVMTKNTARCQFDLTLSNSSAVERTNLHATAVTIGGTAYLNECRSWSASVRNNAREGSGLADYFKFPVRTSTDIDFSAEFLIDGASPSYSTPPVVQPLTLTDTDGEVNTSSTVYLAYSMAAGGVTFGGTGAINSASYEVRPQEIQAYRVSWSNRGAPTITGPSSTTTTYDVIAAAIGSSQPVITVTFAAAMGTITGTSKLYIESCDMRCNDEAIITISGSGILQSAPTWA